MPKEVSAVLRTLKNAWRDAEPTTFKTYPDGDYLVKVINMEVGLSKNQRPQIISTLKIMDGKFKGQEIMKYDGIQDEVAMGWFKGYCEVLGIEIPEDIEQLPDILQEYVDTTQDLVNVTLRSKEGFQNVFAKGLSDYTDAGAEDEPAAEEEPAVEEEPAEELVRPTRPARREPTRAARPAKRSVGKTRR